MNVDKISLLKKSEYQIYKNIIPEVNYSWWVINDQGTQCLSLVSRGDIFNELPNSSPRYVRPTFLLSDIKDIVPGDKITIYEEECTVLRVTRNMAYVICDSAIALKSLYTKDCSWKESKMKKWLEKWMHRMQTIDHITKPTIAKKYRNSILACKKVFAKLLY